MFKSSVKTLHRRPLKRFTSYCLPLTVTFIMAYCLCLAFNPFVSNAKAAARSTWYVSKNGNNADGLSWATAWNELNQINWSVVQPGETIQVDGGSQSMTY